MIEIFYIFCANKTGLRNKNRKKKTKNLKAPWGKVTQVIPL